MIHGLPDKLKELRAKRGLSQKQVADRVGISPSIVSGYETGERTPSAEVLLSLSSLYHCSTDYLLGKQSETIVTIDTSGLTEKQIQAINALVESIRDS